MRWCTYRLPVGAPRVGLVSNGQVWGLSSPPSLIDVIRSAETTADARDRAITSPQNGWIESFNGRLRDEFLNSCQFGSVLEAKVLVEDWRTEYNYERPHSALGMLSPAEFVEAWTEKYNQLQLS